MYRKGIKGWLKHYDFIILDQLSLQLSFIIAFFFRIGRIWPYAQIEYRNLGLMLFLLNLIAIATLNPFSNVLRRGYWKEFLATCKHSLLLFGLAMFYVFGTQSGVAYSRIMMFLNICLYVLITFGVRLLWKIAVRHRHEDRALYLVADHPEKALSKLKEGSFSELEIKVIDPDMIETLVQEHVDGVFVELENAEKRAELISKLELMGVNVHVPIKQISKNHHQVVENIGGYTVITSSMHWAKPWELAAKRCMDILGGLVGCLLTGIICLVVGPKIKKESPGPIFYSHERIGLNGKRFKMYKIRSMVLNADELKAKYADQNRLKDGMMFKLDWDPRIIGNKELPDGTKVTGIGEFIRKTSLDEFPQFFNVLKGDMSLVGTRPPTVDEWQKYDLHHRTRMATKPGITGMWQVSGRSDIVDFEEVVKLDTEYIYNWNLGLDIKILLKTVISVLKHEGAM